MFNYFLNFWLRTKWHRFFFFSDFLLGFFKVKISKLEEFFTLWRNKGYWSCKSRKQFFLTKTILFVGENFFYLQNLNPVKLKRFCLELWTSKTPNNHIKLLYYLQLSVTQHTRLFIQLWQFCASDSSLSTQPTNAGI